MKRLFDILASSVAILVLAPLLLPVMVILKLTGEHYIFYRQERVGKDGKSFGLFKFATMLKNSPNMGTGDITTRNDPRVLPFGRLLRKTKINELPQIINVLKGDMSLIGPRPLTPRNFSYYSETAQEAIRRLQPGLSGVGSIVYRNEEALIADSGMDPHEFYLKHISPHKGVLEIWYGQHRHFGLDLKLIGLTVLVILKPNLDVTRYLKHLPPRPDKPHAELSMEDKMAETTKPGLV